MKQQISLPIIAAVIVIAVGLVAYIGYKAFGPPPMTATPAANSPITDMPTTINGKPVPAGVPYDYAVKAGMVKGKTPDKPATKP
jgi:hypothetical protein